MEILPEVEVWYALPALRKGLAEELKKQGLTQKKIAEILQVQQSTVSQYLNGKRAETTIPETVREHLQKTATDIAEENITIQRALIQLTETLRNTRAICDIHAQHAEIPEQCNTCFENK